MVTRHCKRCHPLRNAYLGRSFPGIGWKRTYAVSLGSSPMGQGEGGGGWLNYCKDISRFILLYGLYINIIFFIVIVIISVLVIIICNLLFC